MLKYHKNPVAVFHLSPEQYRVTQRDGTERPFENAYWDNKQPGIYVDVVSGEPLFTSLDKFDSGCGRVSLGRSRLKMSLNSRIMTRIEVRSTHGDSHLGHVFLPEVGGLLYCINSASLRFVPLNQRESGGYGSYRGFFQSKEKE